jgi:hypothetical protein
MPEKNVKTDLEKALIWSLQWSNTCSPRQRQDAEEHQHFLSKRMGKVEYSVHPHALQETVSTYLSDAYADRFRASTYSQCE